MLGQATVATLCLPRLLKVPTWSSDPLEITAACISRGSLHRRPGRCMRSVYDLDKPTQPVSPSRRQPPAILVHRGIRSVFWWMWGTVALSMIFGGTLLGITNVSLDMEGVDQQRGSWSFFPGSDSTVGSSEAKPPYYSIAWIFDSSFNFSSFCTAFTIIGTIQAVVTLSLHCAELVVNRVRGEILWRSASKGGHRPSNALKSMLSSFPALALFTFKPVIHWLYSLAISVYFSEGINMRIPQIFYLGVGATFLAIFTTACAFWSPKGPQPAAFGHLQTLADLVDVWPQVGESMFWGQKDPPWLPTILQINVWQGELDPLDSLDGDDALLRDSRHIWHAGTSAERLEPVAVDFSKKYMGSEICKEFCLP